MRYSLLSRFQGTLLAAALGCELGVYSRSRHSIIPNSVDRAAQSVRLTTNLAHWHPGLKLESALSRQTAVGGRIAIGCARALVDPGGWNERVLAAIDVHATSEAHGAATANHRLSDVPPAMIAPELAIATLPLALFFHDDERKQQQRLLQIIKLWRCSPEAEAGLLAVGYAIAQALQDRLKPRTLLPQTIAYLKQSTANPTTSLLELADALEQAQTLLSRGAGLLTAIDQLQAKQHTAHGAIALAFYCFLSTPDDRRLAMLRAARCGEASPIIAALTGAFGGAYQGFSGIPLAWQLADTTLSNWGLSETELRQLAAQLFAAWSGVYAPTQPMAIAAIAAPGIIRPR